MKDQITGKCVESLCHQGCESVRRAIRDLQAGNIIPETQTLDSQQRTTVLKELRAIMAVYDSRPNTCDDDLPTDIK